MVSTGEVLIADDDAATCSLLAAIVLRRGLRPVVVTDGRRAVTLLSSHDYTAILLDLLMPEVSGVEVLAWLASTKPEALRNVIVVTAAHESAWAACPEIAFIRGLHRKPFDLDQLIDAIDACRDAQEERPGDQQPRKSR
ncbi:MAG: response regulator [Acidobacteria bacterium]|nr:response regulator [Acidobacteriota bacterium]MBV9478805.1 response regulator [Acidobacteriota bacterium]